MKSTSSQTSRRAFLRSTAAAAAGLAVLPGARAQAASSPAARKPSIKLGLDNFSVRALGWKAGQLIEYAASLQTDSLFITDLNAFEQPETVAIRQWTAAGPAARVGILCSSLPIPPL